MAAAGWRRRAHRALRRGAQVQRRPEHRRFAAHDARGRPGAKPDERGHRGVPGARLEPAEGSAGDGPRAPAGAEEDGERVPAPHEGHPGGEGDEPAEVQAGRGERGGQLGQHEPRGDGHGADAGALHRREGRRGRGERRKAERARRRRGRGGGGRRGGRPEAGADGSGRPVGRVTVQGGVRARRLHQEPQQVRGRGVRSSRHHID